MLVPYENPSVCGIGDFFDISILKPFFCLLGASSLDFHVDGPHVDRQRGGGGEGRPAVAADVVPGPVVDPQDVLPHVGLVTSLVGTKLALCDHCTFLGRLAIVSLVFRCRLLIFWGRICTEIF